MAKHAPPDDWLTPGGLVQLRAGGGPTMVLAAFEPGMPPLSEPGWRVHWSIQGALRSAVLPAVVLMPVPITD